ncbi:MAG TPA: hypothetical protein VD794_11400 [Flavisolibacter sp.]|nr:hypothetical protein [Flavisolibacter sp.]
MKTLLECEFEYVANPHLMQIYAGFFELHKKGIIRLKARPVGKATSGPHILVVTINKKYKVAYDALDGFSWIIGDKEQNLSYFQNNFKVDFYFKRSFHQQLYQYKPANCHIFPLGLNYNVYPDYNMLAYNPTLKDKLKYVLKTNRLFNRVSSKNFFYAKDFEHHPTNHSVDRILFITRAWDPQEARWEGARPHREMVNQMRAECIRLCRKEFGDRFTGGLSTDAYSTKHFADLIIPNEYTGKSRFLQAVKEHSICIATTGLHDSIGWKLGEYVAASRAIVSEPLHYEVPGNFKKDQNYLAFETPAQLIEQIQKLLDNKELILQMMQNNHQYYTDYVKPDKLVLNTLLQVLQHIERHPSVIHTNDSQVVAYNGIEYAKS